MTLNIIGQGETPQDAPKIEFPCPNYPIKVMGEASDEMRAYVLQVMQQHAPGFDAKAITTRPSSKGNYQSLTVLVTATGIEQLQAIHTDLKASKMIKVVL